MRWEGVVAFDLRRSRMETVLFFPCTPCVNIDSIVGNREEEQSSMATLSPIITRSDDTSVIDSCAHGHRRVRE